jgi:hypothetical protein
MSFCGEFKNIIEKKRPGSPANFLVQCPIYYPFNASAPPTISRISLVMAA